jgi:hypothetical protein
MSNRGHVTASVSGLWFGGWFTIGYAPALGRSCSPWSSGRTVGVPWRIRHTGPSAVLPSGRGDVTAAPILYTK